MLGVGPCALEDGNGPFGYGLDASELRVAFDQSQGSPVTRLPFLEPMVLEFNTLSFPGISFDDYLHNCRGDLTVQFQELTGVDERCMIINGENTYKVIFIAMCLYRSDAHLKCTPS